MLLNMMYVISWIHDKVVLLANWLGMDIYGEVWAVILACFGYFIVSHLNTLRTRQSHLYALMSSGFTRDVPLTTIQLTELKVLINKIPSIFSMSKKLLNALDSFNIIINTDGFSQRELCDRYENILLVLATQSYLPYMNKYRYAHDLRLVKSYTPSGVTNMEKATEKIIVGQANYYSAFLVDTPHQEMIRFLTSADGAKYRDRINEYLLYLTKNPNTSVNTQIPIKKKTKKSKL